jgi:hypothetical protein
MQWVSRKCTSLYASLNCCAPLSLRFCNIRRSFPFKPDGKGGSDANHTEKFMTRDGDQQTQAFAEALVLANLYCDDATPNREEVFKLLKIGLLGRQSVVSAHKEFSAYQHRLQEAKEHPGRGSTAGVKRAADTAASGGGACARKQSK